MPPPYRRIYKCETWSTTKGDEEELLRFERKVLRRIYGPTRTQITENLNEEKIQVLPIQLFNRPNIRNFLKCQQIEWAEHVWRAKQELINNVISNNQLANWKETTRKTETEMRMDRVTSDLIRIDELTRIQDSKDRNCWKDLVEVAKRLQGV